MHDSFLFNKIVLKDGYTHHCLYNRSKHLQLESKNIKIKKNSTIKEWAIHSIALFYQKIRDTLLSSKTLSWPHVIHVDYNQGWTFDFLYVLSQQFIVMNFILTIFILVAPFNSSTIAIVPFVPQLSCYLYAYIPPPTVRHCNSTSLLTQLPKVKSKRAIGRKKKCSTSP